MSSDNRLQVKVPRERGQVVLNRVKALIVKEHGSLHGYLGDTLLNLIEFSCDIIEKDPKALLYAHTHKSENVGKRQQIVEIFRFTEKWSTYFQERARLYDDLRSKVEHHFNVSDNRAVNPKIKEVCDKLRLGILRLHDGHRVVISKDSQGYKILESYDDKYKGRRSAPPKYSEQDKAYKAIMRDIMPQRAKSSKGNSSGYEEEADNILNGLGGDF